jgi:hypothetical protein
MAGGARQKRKSRKDSATPRAQRGQSEFSTDRESSLSESPKDGGVLLTTAPLAPEAAAEVMEFAEELLLKAASILVKNLGGELDL